MLGEFLSAGIFAITLNKGSSNMSALSMGSGRGGSMNNV